MLAIRGESEAEYAFLMPLELGHQFPVAGFPYLDHGIVAGGDQVLAVGSDDQGPHVIAVRLGNGP